MWNFKHTAKYVTFTECERIPWHGHNCETRGERNQGRTHHHQDCGKKPTQSSPPLHQHSHTHTHTDKQICVTPRMYLSRETVKDAEFRSLLQSNLSALDKYHQNACVCLCVCVCVISASHTGLTHSWSDTANSSIVSGSLSYRQAAAGEKGHVFWRLFLSRKWYYGQSTWATPYRFLTDFCDATFGLPELILSF